MKRSAFLSRRAVGIAAGLTFVAAACDKNLLAPSESTGGPVGNSVPFAGALVAMDVQPSTVNVFTTASVNVILFSTATFNAVSVNVGNVRLSIGGVGTGAAVALRGTAPITSTRDYDGDGRADRLFTFNTPDLRAAGLVGGSPKLTLRDLTSASNQFKATDATPPAFVGGATAIQNVSGDVGLVALNDARALRVRLVNGTGAGVANLRVHWSVESGGGSVAGSATTSTLSDASGYAQVVWTVGAGHGGQRVVAQAPGLTNAPVEFVGIVREADGSITVSPSLETASAATATIGEAGGTLVATGSNGTRYTLVVPPGGLLDPVAVTLTPLSDVPDAPLTGGSAFGVQMAPDGLKFTLPARLDVMLATAPTGVLVGYGYRANGSHFSLVPTTTVGNTTSFVISHFSGAGGGGGQPLPNQIGQMPTVVDEETALEALAIIAQVAAVLGTGTGNAAAVEQVYKDWYDVGLQPKLVATAADPLNRVAGSNLEDDVAPEYSRWNDGVQRNGVAIGTRDDEARAYLTTAFRRAINGSLRVCYDAKDAKSGADALRYAAGALVLGITTGASDLSALEVKTHFCIKAKVEPKDNSISLKAGQTKTIPIKGSATYLDPGVSAGRLSVANSDSMSADALLSGSGLSAVGASTKAPMTAQGPSLGNGEVPFYVTVTPNGTTDNTPQTATTAAGASLDVTIVPQQGVQTVTLTVNVCVRVLDAPRLDYLCDQQVQSYTVGAKKITGNVTIRNNIDAEVVRDVEEITGDLEIDGTSVLSLSPLSKLAKVGGGVTIGGAMPSLVGLEALKHVGSLNVNAATALTSLNGLNGLTEADYVYVQSCTNLTTLHGLEAFTMFNPGSSGQVYLGSNPKLTDISAIHGVVSTIKSFVVYDNSLLSDLSAMNGVTTLQFLFLQGPAITSLAPFASLTTITNGLVIGADDMPALATYALPALASLPSLSIGTNKHGPSLTTTVSLPALTSVPSLSIGGESIYGSPGGVASLGITTINIPVTQTSNLSISNTQGGTFNFGSLNSATARVTISANHPMPTITIGTVSEVFIDNGAWSQTPRPALLDTVHGAEDLTKISITFVKRLVIWGAANWSQFGPAVGQALDITVNSVEQSVTAGNLTRVCNWIKTVNVPNMVQFPQHKSIGDAFYDTNTWPYEVYSSSGFTWSSVVLCGP